MSDILCSITNISYSYDSRQNQIEGISIKLKQGQALAVLGASGSGKSTLARLIAGFLSPTSGAIDFSENLSRDFNAFRLRQMVFQDPSSALTPFYTPYKTLKEVLKLHFPQELKELDKKIENLLEEVGLDRDLFHKKIHQLSGGEKQRLLIARCLSIKPKLIILDEPLSSCDPLLQKEILDILKNKMQSENLSVLIILHDLNHACYIADEILLLHEGKQEAFGETCDFISSPQSLYTQAFLEAFY